MTYRLQIWYAATRDEDAPQEHAGLTREQVENFVRPEVGFMHDLLSLEGRGVRRITVEIES